MYKIITYHSISNERLDLPSDIGLSTRRFESHMNFFKNSNFIVVPLDIMVDRISNGKVPKEWISITFDDGYKNNYENALPILEKYGFDATIFVISSKIGGYMNFEENNSIRLMDKEEIKILSRRKNISIEPHSHNHKYLPSMSKKEIMRDLTKSKNIIENIVGERVRYLSYPFGGVDHRVSRLARQVGYSEGFSVWTDAERPFARLRIPIATADSWWRLWLKTSALYFPLKTLRSRLTV